MASLISPGVQVNIIDESQYQPTATGTIPYVLLATEQDKLNASGTLAAGTTKANAEELIPVSSQRELVNLFGTPTFQLDANGNPINASELSEYGLLSAYSALGVASRVYIQRADVNLAELKGSAIRPTGVPLDSTYWLDLANTELGIFEWDGISQFLPRASTGEQDVKIITSLSDLSSGVPLASVGYIGEYAVNTTDSSNPIYLKRYDNTWQLVGSDGWMQSWPAVTGTISNPSSIIIGDQLSINSTVVTSSGATIGTLAADINTAAITGVKATVNTVGQLELRIDSTSISNGSISITGASGDGTTATLVVGAHTFIVGDIINVTGMTPVGYNGTNLTITATTGTSISYFSSEVGTFSAGGAATGTADGIVAIAAGTQDVLGKIGLAVGSYNAPSITYSDYRNVPAWRSSDTAPRPAGSVWLKTSAVGNGANWGIKQYSANLDSWVLEAAPLYFSDGDAIFNLDPAGGGAGLDVGTIYVQYNASNNDTASFRMYVKNVDTIVTATGTAPATPFVFTSSDSFDMVVTIPGSAASQTSTIVLTGTTATSLVADILSANIPNVTAVVETSGAISISHLAGGTIEFFQVTGTPLNTAGIFNDANIQEITANVEYLLSPFTPLVYTYSFTAPYTNPVDGTLWYYNSPLDVDIMINDGSAWKGYKNVINDARGYDLSSTDTLGPILAAVKPTTQVSGASLVPGDLWIDTSDLVNYPKIYRYANTSVWELIDNTDSTSIDGILFADARWGVNDSTNPIVDSLPSIVSMQSSDWIDSDAPDYRLYPRGTILFNTRRSGYTVKRFESTWFPTLTGTAEKAAWVSQSGQDANGVSYFGHKAQRNVVVEAMKSAIASSTTLREEQIQYNLIATPGYPELISDMVTLNNDRKQTAFIIGDSPLDLSSGTASIETWASNQNLAKDNGENGLVTSDDYLGVFYPSGLATNLNGDSVVVPPSHAMLRTMIRSDNVSYPWFAPAGVRRGLIDNISSIGYVDTANGNIFRSIGVTNNLRDVLYANNVNPMTVLPGVGLVNYGQKTRAPSTSALDRINVARLVSYLRIVLAEVARPFMFEPNDTITRNQIKSGFEAVLNDIVAKRGLYDYVVVVDTSNNTPARIDRNELWIDIAIEPVKAIEFIYIPVRLRNTGEISAGI